MTALYEQKGKETVKKSVKISSSFFCQPKTNAPDGFDRILAASIPQLPAKVADVLLEGAFRAVLGVQADPVQHDRLGNDLPRILHQQLQDHP